MPQTKLISLDNLTSYDGKIKDFISSYKIAGNALAYFECSTPNDEIDIDAAGYAVEKTIKPEITPDLYMIRFTADASETETARLFNYAKNYPTLVIRRNLPINYYDGTAFTRTIHAGDYIIIKLAFNGSLISGGVIVAEHDSTLMGLRSDVEDYQKQNDLNLETPDRKNILPMTVDGLKAANTNGTWSGNDYVINGVTYTVVLTNGVVTSITASGTASANADFYCGGYNTLKAGSYVLNGCASGGSESTYFMLCGEATARLATDTGNGNAFTLSSDKSARTAIRVYSGYEITGTLTFYPMIRPAFITDSTFAPYVPSVNSRLEAVEHGVFKSIKKVTSDGVKTYSDVFSELFSDITGTAKYYILYNNSIFTMSAKTTQSATFSRIIYSANTIYISALLIRSNSSATFTEAEITANGTTYNNYSTVVMPANLTIELVM